MDIRDTKQFRRHDLLAALFEWVSDSMSRLTYNLNRMPSSYRIAGPPLLEELFIEYAAQLKVGPDAYAVLTERACPYMMGAPCIYSMPINEVWVYWEEMARYEGRTSNEMMYRFDLRTMQPIQP